MEEDFNTKLQRFVPETADHFIFILGKPSDLLLDVGIVNKPLKLFGNKLLKKMKKHEFKATDLMDLPMAIANPIAIFKGNRTDSFSILTEVTIADNNVIVILEPGKGKDIDFNIITSTYGKSGSSIANWINEGKLLYLNKEKAPDYLGNPAPIAGTANNQGQEAEASTYEYTKKSDE